MLTTLSSINPIGSILLILGAAVVFILLAWLVMYNGLVTKRNKVRRALSGIDIQLKKRWDLIPRLVETVKGYAKHERELFERVVEARRAAKNSERGSGERFMNESILSESTPRLLAIAEDYPDLKANEQFEWLQRNLTEVESQISAARRSFNANVLIYNNSLETMPSAIIARKHNFESMDFFSINPNQRQNVGL